MDRERTALRARFEQMSDEELLRRYHSGDMTPVAEGVAGDELRGRGLSLDPDPVRAVPDADPAPDQALFAVRRDVLCLKRFFSTIDAALLCGLLNAEGIMAVAADANMVRVNSALTHALGGVRVMVQETDMPRAREILQALERGEFALSEDDGA